MIAEVPQLERVKLRIIRVRSESELVRALNAYDGPLMIFDGHGAHPLNGPAHLKVGAEEVEITGLDGKVRMPPIVMLSACDTHAAARSTETVANAMLQLGARTVLATNLPVRFDFAALMAVRLILGVDTYLPFAAKKLGRVLRWNEFVGRMLRQQFLLELLWRFVGKDMLSEEEANELHDEVSYLADYSLEAAIGAVEQKLTDCGVMQAGSIAEHVRDLVPQTDVIRYIQLGNPDTITIGSIEDLPEELQGSAEDRAQLAPRWRFGKDRADNVVDMMELVGQVAYSPWKDT